MMRSEPRVREDSDAHDTPELELAARVADRASEQSTHSHEAAPDEERTWGRAADPGYRRAIDDLAVLIEMRHGAELETPRAGENGDGDGAPAIAIGSEWGPFVLLERLGGGVSGDVFKVRDKHLHNHVALKLFHRERVASNELDSLLVEGRQHALVKHPNIAVIHGADENDGRVGIWMEYIDGATLHDLVDKQGTFGAAEAVTIGRELCSALAAVHQRGLTHGDIKAQNVMREKGGRIVLMDFSSSRHERDDLPGGLVGTPIYMAPELFENRQADVRSDIYALGVLLFHLVTGRYPYESRNLKGLRLAVAEGKPLLLDDLRPDLPSGFVRAIHRAIAWRPEDRFQSAGEFHAALRAGMESDLSNGTTAAEANLAPDLTTLVRAARVVTWGVFITAFLATLGYANEINFNVLLMIPDKFTNYSFVDAVVVGWRSLSIPLTLGVMEAAGALVLWGVVMLSRRTSLGRRFARGAGKRWRRLDFRTAATVFAFFSIGSVVAAGIYFRDFFALIFSLSEPEPGTVADLSLLRWACGGEPVFAIHFGLVISQLCLVLVVGWILLFKKLALPGRPASTVRFMKWVSALSILVAALLMSEQWRLLWANESLPIRVGEFEGYIVAQDETDLFVYSPTAPPELQHQVVRRRDSRISWIGDTPEYIFGQESCEGGGS